MMQAVVNMMIALCISGFLYAEGDADRIKGMTVEEKIGQLFILPACPNHEASHSERLSELIQTYHLGGIIMKQAHPTDQVRLLNHLQSVSKQPLLVTGDAEWGLGMRMQETISFPRNLTLGAIQDNELLIELGTVIGQQCRQVGIHLNFAPVADVNNNPENPIIHTRSFGEDPQAVSEKVVALALGMQRGGVVPCLKHFPGHGDVTVDSHQRLPTIPHKQAHLDQIEFVPFKKALSVPVVMSGHLYLPACDEMFPSSLSSKIVTDLLKKQWGFDGLVVTDALNMKALTEHHSTEDIVLRAFLAGHDLLLYGAHSENDVQEILNEILPRAFSALKKGYEEGLISEERLNESVIKILRMKEKIGLFKSRLLPNDPDLMKNLHDPSVYALKKRLFAEAVTLISHGELPAIAGEKVAYLQVGKEELSTLYERLAEKATVTPISTLDALQDFSAIVVGIYEIGDSELFQKLQKRYPQTVFVLFGTPYNAKYLPKGGNILIGYEPARESEEVVSDILLGRQKAKGQLPVSL